MRGHGAEFQNASDGLLNAQDLPEVFAGELVVLAEEASAGAPRQEDGSRAFASDQRRLLAEVRADRGDAEFGALAAEAALAGGAVHAAAPGTKLAMSIGF